MSNIFVFSSFSLFRPFFLQHDSLRTLKTSCSFTRCVWLNAPCMFHFAIRIFSLSNTRSLSVSLSLYRFALSSCQPWHFDYDANRNCVNVIVVLLPTSKRHIARTLLFRTSCTPFMSLHSFKTAIYKELILTFCVRKFFSVLLFFVVGIMQKCSQELTLWGSRSLVGFFCLLFLCCAWIECFLLFVRC